MRLIKKFAKENEAKRFSNFLQKMEIDTSIEVEMDEKTNHFFYVLWVYNEDKIKEAEKYLEEFEKNPDSSKYDISLESLNEKIAQNEVKDELQEVKRPYIKAPITKFFIFFCVFIYLLNLYEEQSYKNKHADVSFVLLTPIQSYMLFDVPYVLIEVDQVIKKYNIDPMDLKESLKRSPIAAIELEKIDKKPFWRGFYDMVVIKRPSPLKDTFEKIRQGQIWRLFSPCLLHTQLLHLLFNMLWLWILGIQIEQRLSKFKYLLLTLLLGVIPNISQYLMTGPYFLGYSGIITGLVGFIWSREKAAPWEGYPLQKIVFLFIAVYVILMFLLSLFSFITQIIGINLFTPNIANTAHLIGAIAGYFLGKMSFFSWSPKHER